MSVRAGTLNQTTGGVHAEVLSRRKHAEYKRISEAGDPFLPNDIAILKLKTPIEKSKTIAYATLPANGSDPAANSTAFIAGWGSTKDMYGGPQALLNKATIPILTREDCSKLDPLAKGNNAIVCAGGVAGQNVCRLDSGGPLVDQKTGEVIGLASWILEEPGQDPKRVTQCGKAPAVFTRVGSYIPFILENLKASKQPENLGKARTL
ncbi:hypothetical protein QQS21_000317 [Conoideocrella luteorostrata]|uniref:Peptidase S1 domain-containing protein n=1 Tax=Conoideocrella luteorostrata TaxID=1105319 RepID=A0AAJ0CZX4_9HYPO|nr:hypothetical protein QQS21_000317 [Conoideocrella luteorostrata]